MVTGRNMRIYGFIIQGFVIRRRATRAAVLRSLGLRRFRGQETEVRRQAGSCMGRIRSYFHQVHGWFVYGNNACDHSGVQLHCTIIQVEVHA